MLLENAGAVGYIFEPTYKMVRRILIPTLESKWLLGAPLESNPLVTAFNRSDQNIEFLEGQILWFGSLEDPELAEGANVDVCYVDEAQYIRNFGDAQDVILRRLRGSGRTKADITSSIVTTTPPPLLPNCRLYDFYENPEKKNPEAKVYRWGMPANIHLPRKYIDEILATHHGSLASRFVHGLFATAGSGSFSFDSTVHLLKNIPAETVKYVVYGVDFGWTNPSAIVCVGFDGDERAYILDEFYQNRTQTETLIEELREMQVKHGNGKVVCDRSEPQAIELLRTAGLNAVADESKRDDGIHDLGGRFNVQPDEKPRIYVSPQCVSWISEVMVYDAEKKENDHAIDATRYALMNRGGDAVAPAWILG